MDLLFIIVDIDAYCLFTFAPGITWCHTIFFVIYWLVSPRCIWKSPLPPGIPYMIYWYAWLGKNQSITWRSDDVPAMSTALARGVNGRLCVDGPPVNNRSDWDKTKRPEYSPWSHDDTGMLTSEIRLSWCPIASTLAATMVRWVGTVLIFTNPKICPGTFLRIPMWEAGVVK